MSKQTRRYLLLTFLIMLLCWGSCIICSLCGIVISQQYFLYIPYLLGGLSPTIASYIVLKQANAVSLRNWLKRNFDFKHSIASYLLVPVLAAVFIGTLCIISEYKNGAPFFALIFMIPTMLLCGGLEEAGWRDILQPELEKTLGFTVSTIIVGLIWWFWHLPLFFIRGVSQYGESFLLYGIEVLGLSFALAAIKKCTKSTWLCILFHCTINALHGIFIINRSLIGSSCATAITIVVSYGIIGIWNKCKATQT